MSPHPFERSTRRRRRDREGGERFPASSEWLSCRGLVHLGGSPAIRSRLASDFRVALAQALDFPRTDTECQSASHLQPDLRKQAVVPPDLLNRVSFLLFCFHPSLRRKSLRICTRYRFFPKRSLEYSGAENNIIHVKILRVAASQRATPTGAPWIGLTAQSQAVLSSLPIPPAQATPRPNPCGQGPFRPRRVFDSLDRTTASRRPHRWPPAHSP